MCDGSTGHGRSNGARGCGVRPRISRAGPWRYCPAASLTARPGCRHNASLMSRILCGRAACLCCRSIQGLATGTRDRKTERLQGRDKRHPVEARSNRSGPFFLRPPSPLLPHFGEPALGVSKDEVAPGPALIGASDGSHGRARRRSSVRRSHRRSWTGSAARRSCGCAGSRRATGVEIYAKLEMKNPGGSVKDRAALAMMLEGERTGALGARAASCSTRRPATPASPTPCSAPRAATACGSACRPTSRPSASACCSIYGADLVLTDPMEGSDGAIRQARAIYERDPHRYFYPDQYSNPANWRAHFDTTGVEILEQTEGRVTHFVAGLGTSGTFVGTGRRLRQEQPDVRLISVQPDYAAPRPRRPQAHGVGDRAGDLRPDARRHGLRASPTEDAHELSRRLAREEGLFVGPSSGAALAAALEVPPTRSIGRHRRDLPRRRRSLSLGFALGRGDEPTGDDGPVSELPAGDRRAGARGDSPTRARASTRTSAAARCLARAPGARHAKRFALDNTFPDSSGGGSSWARTNTAVPRCAPPKPGCTLLGFYHSHPDHPAEPSAVRPRPRLAEPELPHRLGPAGAAEGSTLVAAEESTGRRSKKSSSCSIDFR